VSITTHQRHVPYCGWCRCYGCCKFKFSYDNCVEYFWIVATVALLYLWTFGYRFQDERSSVESSRVGQHVKRSLLTYTIKHRQLSASRLRSPPHQHNAYNAAVPGCFQAGMWKRVISNNEFTYGILQYQKSTHIKI